MSAALVINGTNSVLAQGSISAFDSGAIIAGVAPGNGSHITSKGHFVNATAAGNLLICTVSCWVYANAGGAYVPVPGAPTTPGFTWVFAGSKTSDTLSIADVGANGGTGYLTVATAVYYILNAASMSPSDL